MALRRVRAVLFDLDDTLIPTSRIDRAAIASAAAGACGAERAADVSNRFAALLKAEPFPPTGSALNVAGWRSRLWARAIDDAPSDSVPEAAQRAHDFWASERLRNFKFADDVRALVTRLQTAGYATGILTNGHADVQNAKSAACDAAALFGRERVIIAGEHPEQKPAASVFRVACAALGAPADATVMVGDSYAHDIAGGINAGVLATVWISLPKPDAQGSLAHGHLARVPAGQPEPTFTVDSVLELEAVLEQLEAHVEAP